MTTRRSFLRTLGLGLLGVPFAGCLTRSTPPARGPGAGTSVWTPYWDYAECEPTKAEFTPHWERLEWEDRRFPWYAVTSPNQQDANGVAYTVVTGSHLSAFRRRPETIWEVYGMSSHAGGLLTPIPYTVHPA